MTVSPLYYYIYYYIIYYIILYNETSKILLTNLLDLVLILSVITIFSIIYANVLVWFIFYFIIFHHEISNAGFIK